MLPSWASLKGTSNDLGSEVYRCCMTKLQLQAIVNQQGIEGTGESNLDTATVNGVSVSKWRLDSVTYGKEVSDTLKELVRKYLQQFVGGERVFSTQNGAPRIMTEFSNKPYRFELRDETNPIVSSCVTSTRRAPILTIVRTKTGYYPRSTVVPVVVPVFWSTLHT